MKILISNDGPGAHYYQRLGLLRAFQHAGHEVYLWNIQENPTYDVFDQINPDLFLGQTYNINQAVVKCIMERPNMRVVLRASDHSKFARDHNEDYNILVANRDELAYVRKLNDNGRIDFIHSYYHENDMEKLHEDWMGEGVTSHSLMLAADVFDYTGGTYKEEYASDIAFVGGYWPYKGRNLDRYLLRLCQYDKPYNVKIWGNQGWSCPQYCGWVDNSIVRDVLRSAKICPNISEPHATDLGYDVNERFFKLLSNKCFVLSDYVESAAVNLVLPIVFCASPDAFEKMIQHYLNNPEEKQEYIDAGYELVMNEHTYFHRCRDIFNHLDLGDEADKIMSSYDTWGRD